MITKTIKKVVKTIVVIYLSLYVLFYISDIIIGYASPKKGNTIIRNDK
tara:strand:- start:83 stop:226 length:144 start_codon:yes stop_codon:yes gene_type:complete